MRRGQNPAKFVTEAGKSEPITLTMITYAPFLGGYYAQMLRVLEVSLQSLRATSHLPCDLLVFDNGSCAEVQSYLVEQKMSGVIQFLILSEKNIGKAAAWNFIFGAAPGEIIAYSDSDVLFQQGWLERSLEILENFPKVGMVTARPFRTETAFSDRTLAWARETEGVNCRRGQLIPWEIFAEMERTLGQPEEKIQSHYEKSEDALLNWGGVYAFVGASHWQFIAPKKVLQHLLPLKAGAPLGQARQLDRAVNEAGYLRLMVTDPMVRHIGNCLDEPVEGNLGPSRRRLRDFPLLRRGLLLIHDRIFRFYH